MQGRATEMMMRIFGFWGNITLDNLSGHGEAAERIKLRAAQLRELLTVLGPSFVKAGQVLANRPDIVREDYMNELVVLQDDVPPFSGATGSTACMCAC